MGVSQWGLSVIFFPMIILSWTIERMSDPVGRGGRPKEVLIQGGGSLLTASLAFLLMTRAPTVADAIFFCYPEVLLILLAIIHRDRPATAAYRLVRPAPVRADVERRVMFGLASPARLKRERGIVGMNKRNFVYIAGNNPRHLYPRVDNKLLTKKMAQAGGIAVPPLIGKVSATGQIKELPEFLSPHEQFVIKPAQGSGGKGILVVVGREGERFVKPSGSLIEFADMARHVNGILSGLFSLGGKPDVAMIEGMVQFSDVFDGFSYEGVPDVRVIVYKGYPVMAMTRLSTSDSDGKANLHQGAVGVGLDIGTGRALRAVQYDRPIEIHPDTGAQLADIAVPHWPDLIRLSASCYEVAELGYLGTDLVIDRERGPLILELNARPGLAIQVANGMGMLPRLRLVERQLEGVRRPLSADERAEWSMAQFGVLEARPSDD